MGRTTTYVCTRCHSEVVFKDSEDSAGWGYSESTGLTLCPRCLAEYVRFLEGKSIEGLVVIKGGE